MAALHDEPDLDFALLADLAGVDIGTEMQVVYHLFSAKDARLAARDRGRPPA